MKNIPYFISWSGGKDSCLALSRVIKNYGKPKYLLTMMIEDGSRSRSHGIKKQILEQQADSLGIPIQFYSTSWNDYEMVFLHALQNMRKQGITTGVFGDIQIPDDPKWDSHRRWADQICAKANMTACQPLWNDSIEHILNEFFSEKFSAKIISIRADNLAQSYLGCELTHDLISEFTQLGIHPAGERGEYHTFVTNGPIFERPLLIEKGITVKKDGYWFLDLL